MSSTIVKYVPFQSKADPSFWMKLGDHKLNTLKLAEEPQVIEGKYSIQSTILRRNDGKGEIPTAQTIPGRMRFDQDSISVDNEGGHMTGNENVVTKGQIQILNTIESFKLTDKNELLNKHCLNKLLSACGISAESTEDKSNTEDSDADEESLLEALTSFFCLCHLDLKAHKVLYWFAFPVLVPAPGRSICYATSDNNSSYQKNPAQCSLKHAWGQEKVGYLQKGIENMRLENSSRCFPSYFMIIPDENGNDMKCMKLSSCTYQNLVQDEKNKCIFAFLDVTSNNGADDDSSFEDMQPVGWTLRNLIAFLTLKFGLAGEISIISYRPSVIRRLQLNDNAKNEFDGIHDSSLLLRIQLPTKEDFQWPKKIENNEKTPYNCMGWELNARSKPGPRSVNLAPLLSPSHLAQQATDLNLKLMKWRMIPNLDLESLSNLNVLLLGAGTLGCSVARTLLGWGVRKFIFVDNGKVSYSNPVRQNLFDLVDCEGGGKDKATAAAEALKRIAGPTIESEGHVLTIPMPGHAFSDKEVESVRSDTKKLQQLVDEADVVFLLTDTRESRWLPTVMARASNKMLINAALGLDSWLVMRHGGSEKSNRLGCYFCNDVVAPENSTKNRTLDQQCTVTRPGLAPIASSMAVELMVSLLHHEAKQDAPAPSNGTSTSFSPSVSNKETNKSPLGLMPHQIRGSIVSYTMMTPTVPAFQSCTGCSDLVVNAYGDGGFDFVQKVCCSDVSFLEEVSGLEKFRAEASSMMDDCMDWDEADDDAENDF